MGNPNFPPHRSPYAWAQARTWDAGPVVSCQMRSDSCFRARMSDPTQVFLLSVTKWPSRSKVTSRARESTAKYSHPNTGQRSKFGKQHDMMFWTSGYNIQHCTKSPTREYTVLVCLCWFPKTIKVSNLILCSTAYILLYCCQNLRHIINSIPTVVHSQRFGFVTCVNFCW